MYPWHFVLGGSIILRIGVAKKSGTIGGAIVGLIIAVASLVLFANVDSIKGVDISHVNFSQQGSSIVCVYLRNCNIWFNL